MADDYRLIDVHTHVNPLHMLNDRAREVFLRQHGEDFDAVKELVADPMRMVAHLDEIGVERIGLVNYASPDIIGYTHEVNDWVARYQSAAPDRFIAFGSINPRFCEDPGAEVDRLSDLGIRALKVHPPHQLVAPNDYVRGGPWPALADLYQRASALGMPVMFHTGTSVFPGARNKYGNPMALDDVLVDFPDLKIIMAHGGRPLWMAECLFLLRRSRNVYLDISSIPPSRLLECFPQLEQLADRTLFGSDWPGPGPNSIRQNIDAIRELPLSANTRRLVLGENAARLFVGPSSGPTNPGVDHR